MSVHENEASPKSNLDVSTRPEQDDRKAIPI